MRKIVFFLGSLRRGGAERVVSLLANNYARKGWKVEIVLLLFNEIGYDLDSSATVVDFTGTSESRLRRLPYWLKSVRRYIKQGKHEVIVSFVARINIIVLLAAFGLRRKIIISERNDPKHDGRKWPTKLLVKILYPHAKAVIFQTDNVMSAFGKRIQKIGVKILNPVYVPVHADNLPEKKIVNVGRLSLQKNQKLLIEAFGDIVDKYPEYTLWIYGCGELEDELKKIASMLGISKKVYFPGNVSNIHEQISDAEIFVLSSDYEGLSNALLEALMMGIPCISTRCAGADEVIEHGINGLLVNVGDKEGLEEAIFSLIENEALKKFISRNAKEKSVCFSLDVVMKQWERVIEK